MTRFEILSELGCLICKRPAQIHHIKDQTGAGMKSDDSCTIALCMDHHTGQNGYHHSPFEFGEKYGSQLALLQLQNAEIAEYCDLWGIDYPTKNRR